MRASNVTFSWMSSNARAQSRPLLVVAVLVASAAMAAACDRHHDHASEQVAALPSASSGGNAMQNEMRLLNEATRDAVTAIAYGRLDAIPPSLHRVHEAKAQTEKALEDGAYKLPKNADQLEAFKAQDEAFHANLEALVKSAQANDLPGTTRKLGVVLDGCTDCHVKYRF